MVRCRVDRSQDSRALGFRVLGLVELSGLSSLGT